MYILSVPSPGALESAVVLLALAMSLRRVRFGGIRAQIGTAGPHVNAGDPDWMAARLGTLPLPTRDEVRSLCTFVHRRLRPAPYEREALEEAGYDEIVAEATRKADPKAAYHATKALLRGPRRIRECATMAATRVPFRDAVYGRYGAVCPTKDTIAWMDPGEICSILVTPRYEWYPARFWSDAVERAR